MHKVGHKQDGHCNEKLGESSNGEILDLDTFKINSLALTTVSTDED